MYGWVDVRMDGCMDGCVDLIDGCMYAGMDEWMHGKGECMDR